MQGDDKIIPINIESEMKSAYIDYSMSVIVARALPMCATASSRCTDVCSSE